MKIRLLIAALVFAMGTAAQAASIGLNFQGQRGGGYLGQDINPATEVAGVVAQANWNNTGSTTNNPNTSNVIGPVASTLVDDSGAATAMTFAAAGFDTRWTANGSDRADADGALMNGYLDNTNAGDATITLSNIPYASYDAYVYFGSDGNGRTGTISDGTTTYFFTTASGGGSFVDESDYILATNTTGPIGSGTPANYAVFSLNSPVFTLHRGNNNSGIHGIQIVDTTPAVPEPSTLVLATLGLFSLSLTRRRRRR